MAVEEVVELLRSLDETLVEVFVVDVVDDLVVVDVWLVRGSVISIARGTLTATGEDV